MWFFLRIWFFFFQAEDGIRDGHVTGVQTCALPGAKVHALYGLVQRLPGLLLGQPRVNVPVAHVLTDLCFCDACLCDAAAPAWAPGSSRSRASWARARWVWLLTVPGEMPSRRAVSSSLRSA